MGESNGPARNVAVDGKWYGPDYPDAGQPPSDQDKVDLGYVNRGADESDDEPVGWEAVKTPEQARKFGGQPVSVEETDDKRDDTEADPVGSKAVQTAEEAASFRGSATRGARRGAQAAGKREDKPEDKPAQQQSAQQSAQQSEQPAPADKPSPFRK